MNPDEPKARYMVILPCKSNQAIVIDGRVVIKVLRVQKDAVKLGIEAPRELTVHRQEVFDLINRKNQAAAGGSPPPAPDEPGGESK